jgi:chitinase
MVTQERVPRKMSYWLDVSGWLLVILAIYSFILGPAVGSLPTKNFAIEESSYASEIDALAHDLTGGNTAPVTDKIIAGYFPSWGVYDARKYWVRYIPFDRVTHVNYAFARIDANMHRVIIGDRFADEFNTNDPETANGLPPGNLNQLVYYRDIGHNGPAYKHLKIIISVGGWSWSENFSDAARSPESRWDFAESLKEFVQTHDLDGADIDWEYPTGDLENCGEEGNGCRLKDPINHALLIMACRAKLDELGPNKELSIAVPAGFPIFSQVMPALVQNNYLTDHFGEALYYMRNPMEPTEEYPVIIDGPTAADMLNYIHIMNYDMVGAPWEETTRHHAPLYGYEGPSGDPEEGDLENYNGHFAVQALQYIHDDYSGFNPDKPELHPLFGAGRIPASKLTFGVPMYGRGFKSVDAGNWDGHPGLFQFTNDRETNRVPIGTWDDNPLDNKGIFGYWDILMNYDGDADDPDNALHRVSDPVGQKSYGPYILQGDLFIGYDDQQSLRKKMQYLVDQNMAGVMFWDFPGDISQAQIDQGVTGANDSYPSMSLIHDIAETLEALYAPSS